MESNEETVKRPSTPPPFPNVTIERAVEVDVERGIEERNSDSGISSTNILPNRSAAEIARDVKLVLESVFGSKSIEEEKKEEEEGKKLKKKNSKKSLKKRKKKKKRKKRSDGKKKKRKKLYTVPKRDAAGRIKRKKLKIKGRSKVVKKNIKKGKDANIGLETISEDEWEESSDEGEPTSSYAESVSYAESGSYSESAGSEWVDSDSDSSYDSEEDDDEGDWSDEEFENDYDEPNIDDGALKLENGKRRLLSREKIFCFILFGIVVGGALAVARVVSGNKAAPKIDPDNERSKYLSSLLNPIAPNFNNPSSKEETAAAWMVNTDPADWSMLSDDALIERYVIVLIYFVTEGDLWNFSRDWLSEQSVCDWYGVTCNSGRHVSDLILDDNGLFGSIPSELFLLTDLVIVSMDSNSLTGTLPTEVGMLRELKGLFIGTESFNRKFQGPIPSEIGFLTNLRDLSLPRNGLTGTISSDIGRLTKLTGLDLYENYLSGSLPTELGLLEELKKLHLWSNFLAGTIPSELGALSALESFNIDKNYLYGSIPEIIGNLSNLSILDLSQNELSGTLPSSLGRLTNLSELWLQKNELNGEIPTEFGGLTSVMNLFFGDNKLTGTVPSELGLLSQLTWLDLTYNDLTGTVPQELRQRSDTLVVDTFETLIAPSPIAPVAPVPAPAPTAPVAPFSGTPSTCLSCSGACVTLFVMTDNKPGQTKYGIKDEDNKWVKRVGYGHFTEKNTLYTESICLPVACFSLIVEDSAGNGFRDGGYVSLAEGDTVLVDNVSEFQKKSKHEFCIFYSL